MVRFKEFLIESISQKKVFVCLIPSEKTINNLKQYCKENNITQTIDYDGKPLQSGFDFHLTIFYTDTNSDIEKGILHIDPILSVVEDIEYLGEEKNIATLKIQDSDELTTIFDFYKKVYGLRSSWDTFKPHVSLTYDKVDIKKKPDFPLIFDKIHIGIE